MQPQTADKTAAFDVLLTLAKTFSRLTLDVPQLQTSHPQTSQVQLSPEQSGQTHAVAAFDGFVLIEQHDFFGIAATAVKACAVVAAFRQPQLPHWQSSHVQTPDEQSGHRQSVQPQSDVPFSDVDPENASAQVAPIVKAVRTAGIAKLFMVNLQTKMVLNQIKKMRCNFLEDLNQPSAVDHQ